MKPFALMSNDLETIRKFALVSAEEEKMLLSIQKPIVVLNLTEAGKKLADIVAPDQNTLGFMLPYTPALPSFRKGYKLSRGFGDDQW